MRFHSPACEMALAAMIVFLPGRSVAAEAGANDAVLRFVANTYTADCGERRDNDDLTDLDESFRISFEDELGGLHEGTLHKIICYAGAYNVVSTFVFEHSDGEISPISFAVPEFDFVFANEERTELEAPPRIVGYSASPTLINARFDPKTLTFDFYEKWRGAGDTWSAGMWAFERGRVFLKKFTIDPLYHAPDDEALNAQSYTIYEAPQAQ